MWNYQNLTPNLSIDKNEKITGKTEIFTHNFYQILYLQNFIFNGKLKVKLHHGTIPILVWIYIQTTKLYPEEAFTFNMLEQNCMPGELYFKREVEFYYGIGHKYYWEQESIYVSHRVYQVHGKIYTRNSCLNFIAIYIHEIFKSENFLQNRKLARKVGCKLYIFSMCLWISLKNILLHTLLLNYPFLFEKITN